MKPQSLMNGQYINECYVSLYQPILVQAFQNKAAVYVKLCKALAGSCPGRNMQLWSQGCNDTSKIDASRQLMTRCNSIDSNLNYRQFRQWFFQWCRAQLNYYISISWTSFHTYNILKPKMINKMLFSHMKVPFIYPIPMVMHSELDSRLLCNAMGHPGWPRKYTL